MMTGVMSNRAFVTENFCECCGQALAVPKAVDGVTLMGTTVIHEGRQVRLTVKELTIWKILLRNYPRVAPREAIMTSAWSGADSVGDKTLDVFICKIRKKVLAIGLQIKVEWGIGYKIEKCK